MVGLRINETLHTGAVRNRTYRGGKVIQPIIGAICILSLIRDSDKWHMSPRPDKSGFKATGAK